MKTQLRTVSSSEWRAVRRSPEGNSPEFNSPECNCPACNSPQWMVVVNNNQKQDAEDSDGSDLEDDKVEVENSVLISEF